MKGKFILGFLFLGLPAFSQENWELIHGSENSFSVYNVFMVDTAHIWGQAGKQFYFSSDFGETWEPQYNYDPYSFVDMFFVDSNTGWACSDSGVIKTVDGGGHWTFHTFPNPLGLNMYTIFFLNRDTGWVAGAYKSIYVTHDGGNTWSYQHYYELPGYYFLYDIHFYDALHGCAVGGGLLSYQPIIMTTDDGGATWTEFFPSGDAKLIKVQYVSDSVVWACDLERRLFRSQDQGNTWELYLDYIGLTPTDMHFFNENDAIIAGSFSRTAITNDAWGSYHIWELYFYNAFGSFSFSADNKGLASGYNNLLSTRDGGYTWRRLNERFVKIAFFNQLNGWMIQEYLHKDLLHSTDGGYAWDEVTPGNLGSFHQIQFIDGQTGYAITDKPELLKTTDAGLSWEITLLPFASAYFSDLFFLDENTGFICAYPNMLHKTLDGGSSWETFYFEVINYISEAHFITAEEGWVVGSHGTVAYTSDGGESWEITYLPAYALQGIQMINPLLGFIMASTGQVYRTTDGGGTWDDLGTNFNSAHSMQFLDENNGWITTDDYLYRTYDGGEHWVEILANNSTTFQHQFTDFFALDTLSAWICSMDGRVFSHSGFQGTNEIADHASIYCYPNPVSGLVTIDLSEGISDPLTIRIFSLDGRLIVTRQSHNLIQNRVVMDLSGLPKGIYNINIQGSKISKSLKLVKN